MAKIFAIAVSLRWIYALILFAAMGEAGLKGADSVGYLEFAHDFAAVILSGGAHGLDWLGPNPSAMPLFTWLLALHSALFGALAPLSYVLMQGLFDAGTCVLVYAMARTIDQRYALPAAAAAIVNPTQIVMSGLVYGDTPFVFFVAFFLYAALRWMRTPDWRWALALGAGIAAATLTRVYAAAWMPVLAAFLLIALALGRRLQLRHVGQLASAGLIVALCLAPVVWRNVSHYGAFALTPQGGEHLARHVVPFVKEVRDGTPRARTVEEVDRRRQQRYGPMPENSFEQSRQYTAIGGEDLKALGAAAAAQAWLMGATLNLATPALVQSPPLAQLPRTGFFATPGPTPLAKIENYLFHSDNAVFAWALLIGIAGLALMRLLQLVGAGKILLQGGKLPALALFGLWIVFVLGISGPIAAPKYRLPLEPPLAVLTGAGLSALWRRRPASR